MRRAKKPPLPDQVALASVLVDALSLKQSDDVEFEGFDVAGEVAKLLPVAIGEYLRRFPHARNVNDHLWVFGWGGDASETDFLCFFCRESLNTLPRFKSVPAKMQRKFNEHGTLCGMRLLAGQISGVGPHGETWEPPKPPKPKKAPEKKCPACDGDGFFVVGGDCTYCKGKGRIPA